MFRWDSQFPTGTAIGDSLANHVPAMPSTFKFCLPSSATSVPDRPNWLHEVKYDGYRMMLIRDGDGVRLISRGGIDYAGRFAWIVEARAQETATPLHH